MVLRDSYAKIPTGEDKTVPTKDIRFAVVIYGMTFLYRGQESHKMKRATARGREDRSFNTYNIEKPEAAETICRTPDKAFSTCCVPDFSSGILTAGNNPFNFQMQALWVNQCAPS